ncbi:MAG: Amuc_1100 family pilus-like protein [Verrucomicrobia bacterium]|nr:Amuc_1100 family pilus-like protein [Verrucomicrobiota bacterium]
MALVGTVAATVLVREIQASRRAVRRLEREQREIRKLAGRQPAPGPGTTEQLAAAFMDWRTFREAAEREVFGDAPASNRSESGPVMDGAAAYFAITRFVARMREQAQAQDVIVGSEEWFGFSEYRRQAPTPDVLGAVYRDLAQLEELLALLFEAQPEELKSVLRAPDGEIQAAGRKSRKAARKGSSADPAWHRELGGDNVRATYRVAFLGQTTVLRDFLTALHQRGCPWIVLSVDAAAPATTVAERDDGFQTWITPRPCEFDVAIGLVDRRSTLEPRREDQ